MDDGLEKYAPFIEEMVKTTDELQPTQIGVVLICADGVVATNYFGVQTNTEKASMAYHVLMDAVMDAVFANARNIVETAEDQEDEFDEEDG